jgi:hypothetical protein
MQAAKPRNKVPLIIGGVIAAIILFTPLVLIFSKGSTPPSTPSSSSSSSSPGTDAGKGPLGGSSPKDKPVAAPTPYYAWDTYIDEKFSMAYPKTWTIKQTRETEGKTVVFKPPTIGLKDYLPSIMVTVRENKAHPWLVESEDYYRTSLGYVESSLTLDGMKATKLFGTFPSKIPSQSIHIFLVKDNFSYLIRYQYAGKRSNAESEKLFTSMIANFKFR